jgi:hypothetical protein
MTSVEREAVRNRSLTTLKDISAEKYVCAAHGLMNVVMQSV